ncbi:MAG: tetratricopeptide repeat protein [Campylobacteraceae bacterium]|jgi:tetratricopeptide (TPR) repeat protein|nr:tetratricopeptide repeat protein [Campylobacteraceae bacterium]
MYRYITAIILLFILCKGAFADEINGSVKEKFDGGEDLLILMALDAQSRNDNNASAALYKELYEKTGDKIYLKKSVQLFLSADNWNESEILIKKGLENYHEDSDYERFYIILLIHNGNTTLALAQAEELVKREKTAQNIQLIGSIYIYQQQYDMALKYFESVYNLAPNEQTLIQIADLYIKLNQVNSAIAQLETYVRLNGCTRFLCYKLIDIYGKQKNTDGVLNVYKKLYTAFKGEIEAQKIFEILMFQNKQSEAIEFLEKSGSNPDILLEMYFFNKQYDKAINLADKLYQESNNDEYIAKIAIYEYENAENKTDVLESVSAKFERSVTEESDALYLNYYGYLLINHDINIPKGITLVEQALKLEPDSPYYQDSLAWGFYKQNRCQEAQSIIEKVLEKLNDKEVIEHFDAIKACKIKNMETK